ncbi:class I SAM-dependent methyltransferase, partial [Candidatus Pelagibacter sp.]|nr:class I SAM-dependent methyltransferase [Candidatus Pelagibacter sp.]
YEEKDLIETKKDFLEIGSFEGISALYVLENYPNINLTCVDAWNAETDGNQNFNIKLVEKNFNTNIKKYKKRIKKIKNYSKVFFLQNKKKFDIIYVDGSHKAKDVFDDCVSSWKILKKNGLLILDDFFWKEYNDIKDNTAYGISKFLMLTKSFEIIKLSKYQLFIKKI